MGIGINIAGTGIGLTQTIMNQKNRPKSLSSRQDSMMR